MEARVAVLEQTVRDMRHDIFGNGRPGALDQIRDDIRESREEASTAVMLARKEVASLKEAINKNVMKAALLIAVVVACAGTGPLTLKTLLDLLSHMFK